VVTSRIGWSGRGLRSLAALGVTLVCLAAEAAPRIVAFNCKIGDGRRVMVTAAHEDGSDDEMSCRVSVRGLGGRSAADLVAELRLLPPRGPFRVVASGALESDATDLARAPEIFVSHSTWPSAVDWRARRLRLVLYVLDRPPRGSKRWQTVATRRLDLR
jgi:hypothetical protein